MCCAGRRAFFLWGAGLRPPGSRCSSQPRTRRASSFLGRAPGLLGPFGAGLRPLPLHPCPIPEGSLDRSARGRGSIVEAASRLTARTSAGTPSPSPPLFSGENSVLPGPSGRGTTPYVPLDPLCGPGADGCWYAGFDGWCRIPGRLSGLGIDELGGRRIEGVVPDSSLCSLTLTLRTTRSRLTELVGSNVLPLPGGGAREAGGGGPEAE